MSKKIIIGTSILVGAAGLAYFLMKRSQASNTDTASDVPYADDLWIGTGTSNTPKTPSVSKYPEGTLLRAENSDPVYVIDAEGYRHWVTSKAALSRAGLNIANTKSISTAEMEAIPRTQNISGFGGILF